MRVLGLPIRNCADISNNLVQRDAQVSAIDVTKKILFEGEGTGTRPDYLVNRDDPKK